MSRAEHRLARLQQIAGVMADQALQPVAAATAEIRRIEARIIEIATHRTKLSSATDDPAIAGAMLAQAERLRVKQVGVLSELAAARVKLDNARRRAAKAVGRDHALTALADKQKKAADLQARRRSQR